MHQSKHPLNKRAQKSNQRPPKITFNYRFKISRILAESWRLSQDAKGIYWGGIAIYSIVFFTVVFLSILLLYILPDAFIERHELMRGAMHEAMHGTIHNAIHGIMHDAMHGLFEDLDFMLLGVMSLLFLPNHFRMGGSIYEEIVGNMCWLIFFPLLTGVLYLALRHAADLPIKIKQIFSMYKHYLKLFEILFFASVLTYAVSFTGLFAHEFLRGYFSALYNDVTIEWIQVLFDMIDTLTMLLIIYLIFAFAFAPMLLIEKKLTAWQAIKTSFRGFSHGGYKIIFTWGLMLLLVFLSALPLGIGLIWTIPMLINLYAALYKTIFGFTTLAPHH